MTRLSAKTNLPARVGAPAYVPENHGAGILHIGLGAFARAHLCDYTDRALGLAGGDWRIIGVTIRSTALADDLRAQDGRYSLVVQAPKGPQVQVIGALADVLSGPDVAADTLARIADPAIRIISLTVSEAGYGLLRNGGCDTQNPVVAADLADPENPQGVLGLLALGLKKRFAHNAGPVTVLSCDNLPENGRLLRAALLDFATRAHRADLADRIARDVRFPTTMVDRITPRATPETAAIAADHLGVTDAAALATEPFAQWVIEDDFAAGRPAWDLAGAQFVADVAPFEDMKLRLLNGSHSLMAYVGQLTGKAFIRDVMADADLAAMVTWFMDAARATLPDMGLDSASYCKALRARFANPAIAHATAQIAGDGTVKLPQRIFSSALVAQEAGQDLRPFALAYVAWLAYVARGPVSDPQAARLADIVAGRRDEHHLIAAMVSLPEFLPDALVNGEFMKVTEKLFQDVVSKGMDPLVRSCLAREAGNQRLT